jgi:hypothetical protein
MRWLAPALLLLCLMGSVEAQPSNVVGMGTGRCQEFNSQYQKNPKVAENLYFTWVQGFMSGANIVLYKAKAPTHHIETAAEDAYRQFLRSYCDKYPLHNFIDGVLELMATLKKNPPQAN